MHEINDLFRSEPSSATSVVPAVADRSAEAMQQLRQPFVVAGATHAIISACRLHHR